MYNPYPPPPVFAAPPAFAPGYAPAPGPGYAPAPGYAPGYASAPPAFAPGYGPEPTSGKPSKKSKAASAAYPGYPGYPGYPPAPKTKHTTIQYAISIVLIIIGIALFVMISMEDNTIIKFITDNFFGRDFTMAKIGAASIAGLGVLIGGWTFYNRNK